MSGCGSRGNWRLPHGRVDLSLAMRREHFHAYSGAESSVSIERVGCGGPAAHGDSLRRSGAVPRAQAAVSRNLWALAVSGAGLHGSVRQSEDRAAGNGFDGDHVWRGGTASVASCAETRTRAWRESGADRSALPESV